MNPKRSKHHLLFPQREWELRPQGRRIRQTPSMIPALTRADHDYMHEVVPIVPMLGHHTLSALPELWTPRNDTFADLDNLCSAIDKASASPRVHQLERDLADLAIQALTMQRGVLRDTGFYERP